MLTTRAMRPGDMADCIRIINHTIELGGTTAHEDPFTPDSFRSQYFDDPAFANVALQGNRVVGFQAVYAGDGNLFYVGSFTDQRDPVRGAGRALMEKTVADCRAAGGVAIIAMITADNASGLGFYDRMGYVDIDRIADDHTRPDGQKVDRVVKRLDL